MKIIPVVAILLFSFMTSCNNALQCERHFISPGFTGKVVIYFDQKNGQKEIDKDSCIVYKISEKGECYSYFPFKEGNRFTQNIFKCFEISDTDSLKMVPIFVENEFLQDTANNNRRKYVFFTASGYENKTGSDPKFVFEYYVDYGENYKKY